MKALFLLILMVAIGFACQQQQFVHPSIKDANKLGSSLQRYQRFWDYPSPNGGILLKLPNGTLTRKDGTNAYVSSYYIDATEVCNLHYRSFVEWNKQLFSRLVYERNTSGPRKEYPELFDMPLALMPDTTFWLKQFPNEAIGDLLCKHYFRNPAFDYYPVVGISWEQAQAYSLWRTDRINETILIHREQLIADVDGQSGIYHFTTFNYLNGEYEGTPGRKPIKNPFTGEERRTSAEDDILIPYYRLPTPNELEYAATQVKNYSKNADFKRFRKQIIAHNQQYPAPAYYDHARYNLPYPVMEIKTKNAPQHLQDNVDEWTQQSYKTSENYNWYYHPVDTYYIPIWVKRFENPADTAILHIFAPQHQIQNTSPYKGFRCVMPNLWH